MKNNLESWFSLIKVVESYSWQRFSKCKESLDYTKDGQLKSQQL